MNRFTGIFRPLAFATVLLPWATPVRADLIPGATIGGQVYRAGAETVFMRYLGSHGTYFNDLRWYFLPNVLVHVANTRFTPIGQEVALDGFPAPLVGSELVFATCTNIDALPPPALPADDYFVRCTRNTYVSGPGERNAQVDGLPHSALWTREAWIAGCTALPEQCDPLGLAALIGDPSYTFVMGFEDSHGYGIDADFNDMVIALRGATVVPEPLTMALVATGLAGIGGASAAKRRRRP